MRYAQMPVRTVAPAATPVSLDEAKKHLRVTDSTDDGLITALIAAVTAQLDGWSGTLGRCLVTQTWTVQFDCWPTDRRLVLPFPDVQSAVITCRDPAGGTQTLDPASYSTVQALPRGATVVIWPETVLPALEDRPGAVTVTFVAGYGAADAVPAPIKTAILLSVGHLYALGSQNLFLRRETVDGVGSTEWTVSEAAGSVIAKAADALLMPYRMPAL